MCTRNNKDRLKLATNWQSFNLFLAFVTTEGINNAHDDVGVNSG